MKQILFKKNMGLTDKGGCNGNLASMWQDSNMWGQKYLAKNKNELPPRTRHNISRNQKNVPRPHVSHTW